MEFPALNLQGEPLRKAHDSLLSAFADYQTMSQLVSFWLGESLASIAAPEDMRTVAFKLIEWAKSHGRDGELMAKAHQENPGNPALRTFVAEYLPSALVEASAGARLRPDAAADTPLAGQGRLQTFEPCYFDLNETVDDFLDQFHREKGLFCFTVCCPSPSFQINYCQRLKHQLGRNNVTLKTRIVVHPIYNPMERVMHTIRQFKQSLRRGDILLAVEVLDRMQAHQFWDNVREEFKEGLTNNFIILMIIGDDCDAPPGTFRLTPPRFRKAHVMDWVTKIVHSLDWPQEFVFFWVDVFLTECTFGGELLIESVYEHLQDTLQALHRCGSMDNFRAELEQRG